ncbi:conjugal transfer protein TraG N-terminal domain-containing protein [Sphingomonas sp. A2-49]|uniref:conjugal transfer protein TraG N-terminal domain-containing protein n=1 Tax=Sphingomonas sp. A2-49 TaxID=1391375 RepID=UPI0021D110F0|nr:conjugal transfer protein TraG N-terminal domain-containing protein [Sphingomonas sp. A2-49]MCU6453066.1 conjugal transfer protein TraG N-terminal domain-containing protein [Sphingomonas sp. A2-49]
MVELFTIGGGEYVVNVLNAVAAWTGDGGYKSLLQVCMVMGLGYSVLIVAFNADWRAWLNWFLQATLMYMVLMVPRLDVHVTDRINPSLAPAQVANVPLGLAMMASFTSQVGDYLVGSAELVFGLPGDLDYSRNGMIYGSRLFEATQNLRINDSEFAANLDEHFRQCVFYDVLLGRYSMETLSNAPDIWGAIGPGSQARAQRFLTRDAGGAVTSSIETCRDAYTTLSTQWAGMTDDLGRVFGRQLYPRQSAELAKAKLFADLPVAYRYLTGVSASASEILKQTLTINAMSQAMHSAAGATGTGSVDVYAQTRAEIQTKRTYGSIAHSAMKWVPVLNIVLTVVFYALFPVLFPLFLMPKSGPLALRGYVTGFFYLAAWGPLYVILHMVMMFKGASEVAGAGGGNGLTLASFTSMSEANDDIGMLAGYLVASIPFLAGGIAKGAMAISSQATSYLNPSQNAAEEAAREASTGNIGVGNASFDNQTIQTRQHDQWNQAPSFTYGAAQTRAFNETGTLSTSFAANDLLDVPVSKLPFSPQVTQSVATEASRVASETRTRGETLSNQASESVSNAVNRFNEFRHAVSNDQSIANSYGAEDRSNITSSFNEVDQASRMLQSRFGLRAEVADSIATEKFVSGSASLTAGAGGNFGVFSGGVSATGSAGMSKRWTDGDTASVSREGSRIRDALESWSANRGWSENRDAFSRSVETSSRSDISSSASGISSSMTEAHNFSREARRFYEEANRLEARWSTQDGEGVSGSLNTSDAFLAFARAEIASTPLVYRQFDPANGTHWRSTDPQVVLERDLLMSKYIEHVGADMRADIAGQLLAPNSDGLTQPSISNIDDIRAGGTLASQSIPTLAGAPGGEDLLGRANDIRGEVVHAQGRGKDKIERNRQVREEDTSIAERQPGKDGVEQVREWSRSVPLSPLKRD